MPRPDELGREIRELEEQIRILQMENDQLAERAEDTLLLGLIAEQISGAEEPGQVLESGLERISVLKDIPFCACCSLTGSKAAIVKSYLSFTDEDMSERTVVVPEVAMQNLAAGRSLLLGDEGGQSGLFIEPEIASFAPLFAFCVPFKSIYTEANLFFFADNKAENRFPRVADMLHRITEMIVSKLDNLSLFHALQDLNRELDRKIEERTRELQESESRFRQFFENAPAYCYMISQDGLILDVNRAALEVLAYRKEELVGKPVQTVYAPESLPRMRENFETWKATGRLSDVEMVILSKTGEKRTVLLNADSVRDHAGKAIHSISVHRDITELKLAEHERSVNLRFFESMDKVNRSLQGTRDLDGTMNDVLEIMLAIFDCDRAWLLYPCDPEAPSWRVPLERTRPEYPGVLSAGLDIPMSPDVAEDFRKMRSSGGPVTFGPGADYPLAGKVPERFRYQSQMSMTLYPKIDRPWLLGLHQCSRARVWTMEEKRLFQEIGRRLADALTGLLTHRDLRKSEGFLNNIVENIPNMIFVKDAEDLKFVRFNRAGEQLLDCSREDMLGKNVYDLFPKDEADFFTEKDREVLGKKALVDIPEETARTRSGHERVLHTKKIPIMDETGKPQYLLGISEDITERKKAEESVRKLSQAIEQSPVSIVITDASGTIEFVNTKFTQITGYAHAEALGRTPRILKSGETPPEEYRRLWKTISAGGVWRGEFHNRKKNGELFWEQATIAPIRNADKVITHYVAVKEDITEHKKLEDRLRQAQKMEAIGTLAGGVAHDFNNILTAIIGYGTMAKMKMSADDPLRAAIDQILTASERAAHLTQSLLAFSRKQVINAKPVNLNDIVRNVEKLLRRIIGEDVELSSRLAAGELVVFADAGQIEQLLMNLAANARDAMPEGGTLVITTQAAELDEDAAKFHGLDKPGKHALLAVSDSGSGMDEATRNKIFEPFFTTKEVGRGTGLGLAIAYGIVQQHNGGIAVYSEPGKGTMFKIYLPLAAASVEESPATPSTPPRGGTETILLAEDDRSVMDLTRSILQDFGYRVIDARDGQEAVDKFKEQAAAIDLLLLDVIMPKKSGRDVYEAAKADRPGIKVIFTSGYAADLIQKKGIFDEGTQFLPKPVSPIDLLKKIREVLDTGQ